MICILTITAVSAAENEDNLTFNDGTTENIQADNVICVSNDENVLGDAPGTFTELQTIIDGNESGSIIDLDKNYTYDSDFNKTGILISKNLTIDGHGFTLDANNESRIFNVQAADVVLKNINFINANYDNGCVVNFENTDKAVLENCNFTDSVSSYGAVYFIGENLTISCCEFLNLTAARHILEIPGSITTIYVSYSRISMIYAHSSVEVNISKSKFRNSRFSDEGITIDGARKVTFDDNVFENNYDLQYQTRFEGEVQPENMDILYSASASLINIKSEELSLLNSEFKNNTLQRLAGIDAYNVKIGNASISDSKIGGIFNIIVNNSVAVENITISNLDAVKETYHWLNESEEYVKLRDRIEDSLLYIQPTFMGYPIEIGNVTASIKNINVSNVNYNPSAIFSINVIGNLTMENINVDDIYPGGISEYWDSTYNTTVKEIELSECGEVISAYVKNATLKNIHVSNHISGEEGYLVSIENNGTVYLEDVSFENITGKDCSIISIDKIYKSEASGKIILNSISFNNVLSSYNESSWDSSKGEYIWSNTTGGDIKLIEISESLFDVEISNVSISNYNAAAYPGVIYVTSNSTIINGFNMTNSSIGGEPALIMDIRNSNITVLENILFDNISVGDAEILEFDSYYDCYIYSFEGSYGSLGIMVSSESDILLNNINITNSKIKGESEYLFSIRSKGDIKFTNVHIGNISEDIYINMESNESGLIDFSSNQHVSSASISLNSENNIELYNLTVNNVKTSGEGAFLSTNSANASLDNISMTGSYLNSDEDYGIFITADNLMMNNFILANLSQRPMSNHTWYDDELDKYIYELYPFSEEGWGVRLEVHNSTVLSNILISNVSGISGNGALSLDNCKNIFVDNITVDTIYPFISNYVTFNRLYEAYFYTNSSNGGSGGLSFRGTNLTMTNVFLNNLALKKARIPRVLFLLLNRLLSAF